MLISNPQASGALLFVTCVRVLTVQILEKEIDPPMGEKYRSTWLIFEDLFNIIFLGEVCRRAGLETPD